MRKESKNIEKGNIVLSQIKEIEKLHPHQLLAILALFGNFLILVFLLVSMTIELTENTVFGEVIRVPKFYLFSAILMPFANKYFLKLPLGYFKEDIFLIQKQLLSVLIIGCLFIIFQLIGWLEFIYQGLNFKENIIGTYVYLITGLYFLHLLIGLGLTAIMILKTGSIRKDAVKELIFFTAPYEKIKLEILSLFWRFQIFLWIFIVVWFVMIFY